MSVKLLNIRILRFAQLWPRSLLKQVFSFVRCSALGRILPVKHPKILDFEWPLCDLKESISDLRERAWPLRKRMSNSFHCNIFLR